MQFSRGVNYNPGNIFIFYSVGCIYVISQNYV